MYNFKELYYDPVTKRGFIEYRLWTIRKHLSPSKKKYTQAAMRKQNMISKASEENLNEELLLEDLYKEKVYSNN